MFLSMTERSREKVLDHHLAQQTEAIREIHQLLTQNLDRRYTIEELSKMYLMNTSSLKSVFKSVYGLPIASYMKNYRLKEAARQLRSGNEAISVIAGNVGYENQSKFTTAFKAAFGILPTEYRKQYR